MSTPSIRRSNCFALVLTASLLTSHTVSAEVEILDSGARYNITPSDTKCVTNDFENPSRLAANAEAFCSEDDGTLDVEARTGSAALNVPPKVKVGADARFQYRFTVDEVPNATAPSFVPLNVRLNAEWAARLRNTSKLKKQGTASLESFLRLRISPRDDPTTRGEIVENVIISQSVHNGISGCLTIPESKIAAGLMALKCTAGIWLRAEGNGIVSFSTVVETGRTYTIELGARARANKVFSPGIATHPWQYAGSLAVGSPPALKWDRMTIQVGTDPATLVTDLQNQIDDLAQALQTQKQIRERIQQRIQERIEALQKRKQDRLDRIRARK